MIKIMDGAVDGGWGGRQIFKIMGNQSIDLNSFMGGMIICIHKIDKNFQKLKNFLISKHWYDL